jgi:hypothetical protein
VTVALQKKLDRAIAEPADAVIENNWIGVRFIHRAIQTSSEFTQLFDQP